MDALGLTKQLKRVLPPIAIEQVGEQLHSRTQVSLSGVPQSQTHWSQEFPGYHKLIRASSIFSVAVKSSICMHIIDCNYLHYSTA